MDSGRDEYQRLERYREYLQLLGRLEADPRLQGKLDLSGVVQQTLLEASQALTEFRGQTENELAAWLRRIFSHNLTDEVRRLGAQSRDIAREHSIEAALEQSSDRLEAWLAADHSSPSHRAVQHEKLQALAHALAALPDDQRSAIEMHHLRGWSLALTAEHMQRSRSAVAALVFRGLENLRRRMTTSDDAREPT